MKKLFPLLLMLSLSAFGLKYGGLSEARELADRGIIVNQSSMAQEYRINSSLDAQEAGMYRLSDELIRQEALGIALKLKWVTLSDTYTCRNYFTDIREWWVCRAAEISADHGMVTRANLTFRPHDSLTLGEGLAIAMKSLGIQISSASTTNISDSIPIWQKRLILTIQEKNININVRDDNGRWIAVYDTRVGTSISGFTMSHRLTRGQFFQIIMALLNYQEEQDPTAHCATFNDGCNDCTRMEDGDAACTKRMCFWQGTPKCYTCEAGYTLQNDRCVRAPIACVAEGWYAGGGFVMGPENPNDFVCCAGLTKSLHWSDETGDAGNTCVRLDGVCDSRYESARNSSDCRDEFDPSVCKSYYDGCNSCARTEDGQTVCTLRYCSVNGPAYCTEYIPYAPANQLYDTNFISKVVSEMRSYASRDLSCTTDSQCQWSMVGYRVCGGPTAAIAYSTKNIDQALITSKASYITAAEKKFNEEYDIVSDCMYVQPPKELACVSGTCQ